MRSLPLPRDAGDPDAGAVIPSVSLEALLARRGAAIACLGRIATTVREYQEIGATIWTPEEASIGPRFNSAPFKFREPVEQRPAGRGTYLTDDAWLATSVAAVDAALWDHLLDRSGLRTFLDHKARAEWDKQIEEHRTPPLTEDNIRGTFRELHARRGEFFERGVLGVFRSLSWDYKTNRPQKFGHRLILRGVHGAFGFANPDRCSLLDDLERAFHVLEGKPEPDHREGVYSRLGRRDRKGEDLVDAYLRIRTFKNGNAHVTMLRQDLVDELNRILAKHYPDALPPARDA